MSSVHDIAAPTFVAADTELPRHRTSPTLGAGATVPKQESVQKSAVPRTGLRRLVHILTIAMTVVAVAVFLLLAIGPRVLGYQTSTMLTGSMSPLINPGDLVVTVPTPITDIHVGDIITYQIPVEDHRVETHRVTEILANEDGSTAVITKGDANNGVDPWIASLAGRTVDKHVLTVPYVGLAIRSLRQPIVLNTLMYGAPAVLVVSLLASIWRKEPKAEASE